MDLYLIARQQIEQSMTDQFGQTPVTEARLRPASPRPALITTLRARLSTELRGLATAIEPRQPQISTSRC